MHLRHCALIHQPFSLPSVPLCMPHPLLSIYAHADTPYHTLYMQASSCLFCWGGLFMHVPLSGMLPTTRPLCHL
jgi:hypothetical protein